MDRPPESEEPLEPTSEEPVELEVSLELGSDELKLGDLVGKESSVLDGVSPGF